MAASFLPRWSGKITSESLNVTISQAFCETKELELVQDRVRDAYLVLFSSLLFIAPGAFKPNRACNS